MESAINLLGREGKEKGREEGKRERFRLFLRYVSKKAGMGPKKKKKKKKGEEERLGVEALSSTIVRPHRKEEKGGKKEGRRPIRPLSRGMPRSAGRKKNKKRRRGKSSSRWCQGQKSCLGTVGGGKGKSAFKPFMEARRLKGERGGGGFVHRIAIRMSTGLGHPSQKKKGKRGNQSLVYHAPEWVKGKRGKVFNSESAREHQKERGERGFPQRQ